MGDAIGTKTQKKTQTNTTTSKKPLWGPGAGERVQTAHTKMSKTFTGVGKGVRGGIRPQWGGKNSVPCGQLKQENNPAYK